MHVGSRSSYDSGVIYAITSYSEPKTVGFGLVWLQVCDYAKVFNPFIWRHLRWMDEVTGVEIGEYVWFNSLCKPTYFIRSSGPNLRSRYYKAAPVLGLTTLLAV